jgi:hypothetical protein
MCWCWLRHGGQIGLLGCHVGQGFFAVGRLRGWVFRQGYIAQGLIVGCVGLCYLNVVLLRDGLALMWVVCAVGLLYLLCVEKSVVFLVLQDRYLDLVVVGLCYQWVGLRLLCEQQVGC